MNDEAKITPRPDFNHISDEELHDMADGCTEFTCLYHGSVNIEIRRRRDSRDHA